MAETGWSGLFDGEYGKSRRDMKKYDQINRTNAGTPQSALVPLYVGEIVLDTTNRVLYRAMGPANTDWLQTAIAD